MNRLLLGDSTPWLPPIEVEVEEGRAGEGGPKVIQA